MGEVYKTIDKLLEERNITGTKLCADLGMSRSFLTELRKGRTIGLNAETAQRIANYFGVSIEYLLTGTENAPTPKDERVSDEDIKFALFGGDGEITDEMFEEVKQFAQFIREREKGK